MKGELEYETRITKYGGGGGIDISNIKLFDK